MMSPQPDIMIEVPLSGMPSPDEKEMKILHGPSGYPQFQYATLPN